jgi:NAD(P)-dependent dehydrogenase (short-subunit alcohol dehydrogenase family)
VTANKPKVVVLTGAGGQFGHLLAQEMAPYPDIQAVLLTSEPDRLRLALTDTDLTNTEIIKVDLADSESVKSVFASIHEKFGDIDSLINNAALPPVSGFEDFVSNSNDLRVRESYVINCAAPLWCIKYCLNQGETTGKVIINVLTARALTGHTRHIDYFSSKGGLYNATISFAHDYPRHRFRSIMSGNIDTGNGGDSPQEMWQEICRNIFSNDDRPYREIYFMPRRQFYLHLLRYYLRHFFNTKRLSIGRRGRNQSPR